MIGCFRFALVFLSTLKYYFKHVCHLTWKIIIRAIIGVTLRAFIVEEGKLTPVSQRMPALLGPVGLIRDFSPFIIGKISTSQNPLL